MVLLAERKLIWITSLPQIDCPTGINRGPESMKRCPSHLCTAGPFPSWIVIANKKNVGSPVIKLIYFPEGMTSYILLCSIYSLANSQGTTWWYQQKLPVTAILLISYSWIKPGGRRVTSNTTCSKWVCHQLLGSYFTMLSALRGRWRLLASCWFPGQFWNTNVKVQSALKT